MLLFTLFIIPLAANCFNTRSSQVSKRPKKYDPAGPSWADLIASKDETIAGRDQTIAGRDLTIAGKDETIEQMKGRLIASIKAYEAEKFQLQRELDVSRGITNARALVEAAIRDIYKGTSTQTTTMCRNLFDETHPGCSGLKAYLTVAAIDNQENPNNLFEDAGKLWSLFSSPAHSQGPNANSMFPTALFTTNGRSTMIAFAAVLRFSGRNIKLYDDTSGLNSGVVLRPIPLLKCEATVADVNLLPPSSL